MRFLLIERPRTNDTQLSAFDTVGLLASGSSPPELMDILDFIEQNPDYFSRNLVTFWQFITPAILPPEQGICVDALRKDSGARFLEIYVLGANEQVWDRVRCADQTELKEVRATRSLYALVPLRRGKPHLSVVDG